MLVKICLGIRFTGLFLCTIELKMRKKHYQGQIGRVVNRRTLKRELRVWQRGGAVEGSVMTHAEARALFQRMGWHVNVR